jgi:hypothetical protein
MDVLMIGRRLVLVGEERVVTSKRPDDEHEE